MTIPRRTPEAMKWPMTQHKLLYVVRYALRPTGHTDTYAVTMVWNTPYGRPQSISPIRNIMMSTAKKVMKMDSVIMKRAPRIVLR